MDKVLYSEIHTRYFEVIIKENNLKKINSFNGNPFLIELGVCKGWQFWSNYLEN